MKFFLVAALCLAVASASRGKNEQNGRFDFYKVKAKTNQQVEVLRQRHEQFGDHQPLFLQQIRIGRYVYVLIEQSKVQVFEALMRTHKISFYGKGLTLVESISVKDSEEYAPGHCDCSYRKAGGCKITEAPPAGWACKCRYKGAWTCDGDAFQCDSHMHCPADCYSRECCETGRGDCGGYGF